MARNATLERRWQRRGLCGGLGRRRGRLLLRRPAGGKAKDICAWEGGVYIIGLNDYIYKSSPNGWVLLPGEGKAKRIAVDADSGQLWVIGMNEFGPVAA